MIGMQPPISQLEEHLSWKKSAYEIANAVMRHFVTNSFTYYHIFGALLTDDYATAFILFKKLAIKTAFQYLTTYLSPRGTMTKTKTANNIAAL